MLVTGGAGFIGSHLVEALLSAGKAVCVLDDLSTGSFDNLAHLQGHPRFRFVQGSVLDPSTVHRCVADADFVYHLAAAVGVSHVLSSPVRTICCNTRGTETVLEAANSKGAGVLLTSTSEVYGNRTEGSLSEDLDLSIRPPTSLRWGYACSKLMDEFLALAYRGETGLPVFVVRLFNIVGPRQTGRYGMVMPRFIQQALRGEPITVYGDGSQTRCFCDIHDVVPVLRDLPRIPEAVGEIYNIGSTEEVSILALAKHIKRITHSGSRIDLVPYRVAHVRDFEDIQHRVPNIQKLARLLHWRPTVDLESMIRRLLEATAATATPGPGQAEGMVASEVPGLTTPG
jgi:UDP-glucose 4-epimerase